MTVSSGMPVWVPDAEEGFVEGTVSAISAGKVTVKTKAGKDVTVNEADAHSANPVNILGVEDMTGLLHLNEPGILQNINFRYEWDLVYTFVGQILIAVNPFKRLNSYGKGMMERYRGIAIGELAPHAYAVSDTAFSAMTNKNVSQSIIISGESGAGKTETTKICMSYLSEVGGSQGVGRIEDQIMQSNPILEAFGNAKTLRNDNSSRFGKFIQLQFDNNSQVIGAHIEQYLLEKSRLVFQAKDERNYHIFYQLLKGADAAFKDELKLGAADDYHYTNQSYCTEIDGVDDSKDFDEVTNALKTIGMSSEQQKPMWKILAALMHVGNVTFNAGDEDAAQIRNEDALGVVAGLLAVSLPDLMQSFMQKKIKAGLEFIQVPRKVEEAVYARDALAKAVYGKVFIELVVRINASLSHPEKQKAFIGVLDIFGFESFAKNSFEQLCINYANEKLQQFFNTHIFKMEQVEYEKEKINWSNIDFVDNQAALDLIEKKMGILDLLDEETRLGSATDKTFSAKVQQTWDKKNPHFEKPKPDRKRGIKDTDFCVKHFAGAVVYDVSGFLDKNNDNLSPEVAAVLQASSESFVAGLFKEEEEPKSSAPPPRGRPGGRKKLVTVGGQFKTQLESLMKSLGATSPHFIRCIKPNPEKKPGYINKGYVSHQLHCGGVLEAVRIQRTGWPTRMPHDEFCSRYRIVKPSLPYQTADPKATADELCKHVGYTEEQYQVGLTKVFFRAGGIDVFESKRTEMFTIAAKRVQKVARGHRDRVWIKKRKAGMSVLGWAVILHARMVRCRISFVSKSQGSVLIQKNWRCWSASKKFNAKCKAVEKLQKIVRGHKVRKIISPQLSEARKSGKKVDDEAIAKAAEASAKAAAAAVAAEDEEEEEAVADTASADDGIAAVTQAVAQIQLEEVNVDDLRSMPLEQAVQELADRLKPLVVRRTEWYSAIDKCDQELSDLIDETGAKVQLAGSASEAAGQLKSGWLHKRREANSTIVKRRWFVLRGTTLSYYKAMLDTDTPTGSIQLGKSTLVKIGSVEGDRFLFEVIQSSRTYYLGASSATDRDEWVKLIKEAAKNATDAAAEEDDEEDENKSESGHKYRNLPILKEGALTKTVDKGLLSRSHVRHCVLRTPVLQYWRSKADYDKGDASVDDVQLENCTVNSTGDDKKPGFEIQASKRTYTFVCTSPDDREGWMQAIQKAKIQARMQSAAEAKNRSNEVSADASPQIDAVMQATEAMSGKDAVQKRLDMLRDVIALENNRIRENDSKLVRNAKLLGAFKSTLNVAKEGFLYKTKMVNGNIKHWDKRWFVLMDGVLYYFKSKQDAEPVGSISLDNAYVNSIEQMVNDMSKKFSFTVTTPNAVYVLCAQSHSDLKEWIKALESEVNNESEGNGSTLTGKVSAERSSGALVSMPLAGEDGDSTAPDQRIAKCIDVFASQLAVDNAVFGLLQSMQRELGVLKRKLGKGKRTSAEDAMKMACKDLSGADLAGWLSKTHLSKGRYKTWRRRFFVIKDDFLYYYKSTNDTAPTGVIALEGAKVKPANIPRSEFSFEITIKTLRYFLRAPNAIAMKTWMGTIETASMVLISNSSAGATVDEEDAPKLLPWEHPDKSGELMKASGKNTKHGIDGKNVQWQSRYCVLKGLQLFYFKSADDRQPAGVVSLESAQLSIHEETRIDIESPTRNFFFKAQSNEEARMWLDAVAAVRVDEARRVNASINVSSMSQSQENISGLVFPDKQGFLTKQGAFIKSWKRRWFVLQNAMLFYYVSQEEYPLKPKGSIPLVSDCVVRPAQDPELARDFCLELWHPSLDSYYISADNEIERNEWVIALRKTLDALKELQKSQDAAEAEQEDTDDVTYMQLRKMGYLLRRDVGVMTTWSRRLFIIKNGFLLAYREKDSEIYPEQVIPLRKIKVTETSFGKRQNAIEIRHPKLAQSYVVQAGSRDDCIEWIQALNDTAGQFERQDAVLNQRRERETKAVFGIDQTNTSGGLFVMESAWLTMWNEFAKEGSSAPPPGPISNASLLSSGIPRAGLVKGRDFRTVNKQTWECFLSMYGGGPTLLWETFQASLRASGTALRQGLKEEDANLSGLAPPPPPPSIAPPPQPGSKAGQDSDAPNFKEGWMFKNKTHGAIGWKKRWFVLKGSKLSWYKSSSDSQELGSVDTAPCPVSVCMHSKKDNTFEIRAETKSYFLACSSSEDLTSWVATIDKGAFSKKMKAMDEAANAKMEPTIVGIGVILRHEAGVFTVEQIIEGGPADISQKMRVGDKVVEVDGTPTAGKQFEGVLELIRGEQGTFVEIVISREKVIRQQEGEDGSESADLTSPRMEQVLESMELRRDVVKKIDLYSKQYGVNLASKRPSAAGPGLAATKPALPPKPTAASPAASGNSGERAGWMWKSKKAGLAAMMSIQKRYFILRNKMLTYFKNPEDDTPLDSLPVREAQSIEKCADMNKYFGIEMKMPNKSYFIWCLSSEERDGWLESLRTANN